MGLGDVPRDTRAGVAAAIGTAWFPLEPRAPSMAAPMRSIPLAQSDRPTREVFQLFPRRRSDSLTPTGRQQCRPIPSHTMKKSSRINPQPHLCAAHHPTTGKPIIITRGQSGFQEMKTDLTPELAVRLFNESLGVTPKQVEAMLAGSLLSWNCPTANHNARKQKKP